MSRNFTASTKDGLHLLQDIVSDSSRDAATQTVFDTESARNKSDGDEDSEVSVSEKQEDNLSSKESVLNLDSPKAGKRPTSGKPKAQNPLRLVIVPDGDGQKCKGLQLSLEDPENGETNSFCLSLSLTSLGDDCNEIKAVRRPKSSGKFRKPKHPRPLNSWERNKNTSTGSTSSNGTEFATEHHLSRTENPSVLAWLKLKNFEEKEKRKARRRERRELRKAARENAEKKQKREEESEKRFAQWLEVKRREAKRAWRETRARRRVGCVEMKNEFQNDDDPPTNYTVIPSFKVVESSAEPTQSPSTGEVGKTTAPKKTQSKRRKQQKLYTQRPRTSDSPQNRPHLSPPEARPRTANGRLLGNNNTKDNEGSKGITFDAWAARKRLQDKEKAKQRKREIVDQALEEGILKHARKRVENIRQGKKEIDTGIPKWRAKNRVKSVPDDGTTSDKQAEIRKQYALPPESEKSYTNLSRSRGNEKNSERLGGGDERSNSTGVMREIETIRKFCENVKLNSDGAEATKELHQSSNADGEAKPALLFDNTEEKKMITTPDEASESRQNRSDTKAGREGGRRMDGDPKKKDEPPKEKSTVRENYFVYGKGLDPPSMKPAKWDPNEMW